MPSVATFKTPSVTAGGSYSFQPASGQHYLLLGYSPSSTYTGVSNGIQVGGAGNVAYLGTTPQIVGIGYDTSWARLDYVVFSSTQTQTFVIRLLNITDLAKAIGNKASVAAGGNTGTTFRPPAGKMWVIPMWTSADAQFFLQVVRNSDATARDVYSNNGTTFSLTKALAIYTDDYYPRWRNGSGGTADCWFMAVEMDELATAFLTLFATVQTDYTPAAGVEWMLKHSGYATTYIVSGGTAHFATVGASINSTNSLIDSAMSFRLNTDGFATILIPDL